MVTNHGLKRTAASPNEPTYELKTHGNTTPILAPVARVASAPLELVDSLPVPWQPQTFPLSRRRRAFPNPPRGGAELVASLLPLWVESTVCSEVLLETDLAIGTPSQGAIRMQVAEQFYEGLEVGSVSVKWIRTDHHGKTVSSAVVRHEGDPATRVQELFDRHRTTNRTAGLPPIVITGQATKTLLDLPYRSETECIERALAHHGLQPDILLSLGGESFIVYPMKSGRVKNIIATSKCAAGTGEFLVQQFQRMDLSLERGILASRDGELVSLATRCSVHCKTDATHKLNKGQCRRAAIALSLMHGLTKKICTMIESAQWPTRLIVLSGGLSLNRPLVDILRNQFDGSKVMVLDESPLLEAFGASLYARQLPTTGIEQTLRSLKPSFEILPPLKQALPLLDYRVNHDGVRTVVSDSPYILGVDSGSTTTKAVLYNLSDRSVDASCYLRTHGNPVVATKSCIEELIQQADGNSLRIVQAAVTGSGREMVSVYLDNCISVNEILAHARAASDQAPEVDTVFEIGGQDSKYVSFLGGVPIDYAMNESCSAGTGSFLEETVSVGMGIPVQDISSIAKNSPSPIAFGKRCAAFIDTDLRNAIQHGASQDDVVAGLAYSIADNYLCNVVGGRNIGTTVLFQGGVALNQSVALAIAARTKRRIVTPPHPELMGCVGSALMTLDMLEDGSAVEMDYQLEELVLGTISVKSTFQCKSCENNCEIQKISIRKKVFPFGGLCSKFELSRRDDRTVTEGTNLVSIRNRVLFEEFGPQPRANPRGRIGLPVALTSYDFLPFYAKLINELGYDV